MKSFPLVSLVLPVSLVLCTGAFAQDATQAPAGGIISLDDAPLTLVREHIVLTPARVFADYTLRNDTSQPITTTLAFQVPEYTLEFHRDQHGRQMFNDVVFAVDGAPVTFDPQVQAHLHGHDVTSILEAYHLDAASFGRYDSNRTDMADLNFKQTNELVSMGLLLRAAAIDRDPLPRWTVAKQYIHSQTFAPGVPVSVEITYTAVPGSVNSMRYQSPVLYRNAAMSSFNSEAVMELKTVCADPSVQQRLLSYMSVYPHNAGLTYVDFSLLGEHAWKTPAEDFSLQIFTPASAQGLKYVPSVCWSASTPQTEQNSWIAHASNYKPTTNLRVGWFQFEGSEF